MNSWFRPKRALLARDAPAGVQQCGSSLPRGFTMHDWLIIDGNNLLHSHPPFAAMVRSRPDGARAQLVREMEHLIGALARRITVVFDGRDGGKQTGFESSPVEVIFSPSAFTADTVIERLAFGAPQKAVVAVVTSDRGERDTVEAAGVRTIGCSVFMETAAAARRSLGAAAPRQAAPRGKLGDFFPPTIR